MNPAQGVYFRRQDYASFPVRIFIDLVDGLVVGALWLILLSLLLQFKSSRVTAALVLGLLMAVMFGYTVALKRSRFRTLGYRMARVRIVGPDGKTASFSSLTYRLMFAPLGPLN